MWPLNSLQKSGNVWTLLRGPCTGTWWWRPSGTCSLWVRIISLQKLGGYFCIYCSCLTELKAMLTQAWKPSWCRFRGLNMSFLQMIWPLHVRSFSSTQCLTPIWKLLKYFNSLYSTSVLLTQYLFESVGWYLHITLFPSESKTRQAVDFVKHFSRATCNVLTLMWLSVPHFFLLKIN